MNKTNFVERSTLEVDKDLAKNKWRLDWLEAKEKYVFLISSLFFCVSKKMGERKVLTLQEANVYF